MLAVILEVARAIRFQGHIPIKFWGECVLAAVYLINRLPTSVLKGKSPHELFHGHKANVEHLRTIGCLCYATRLPRQDKFSPRAEPCVLMGYSATQKGYLLYSIPQKKLVTSRDVVFKESMFPFKQASHSHKPLFPDDSAVISDDFSAHEENEDLPLPNSTEETHLESDPMALNDVESTLEDTSDEAPTPVDQSDAPAAEVVPARKSTRTPHPPIWMKDYVTQSSDCYSQSNFVSYDKVTDRYKLFLQRLSPGHMRRQ